MSMHKSGGLGAQEELQLQNASQASEDFFSNMARSSQKQLKKQVEKTG